MCLVKPYQVSSQTGLQKPPLGRCQTKPIRNQRKVHCRLRLNRPRPSLRVENEAIYERPVVKRGGADFVSQGSRTSPSPSASVDLAHLRPVRRRFSVHPATHPLSPRPRESFLPQCRQCTKR